jgi:hypothetical protein
MQLQNDYFATYRSLKLTRDSEGVMVAEFHSGDGPFTFTAQDHTEFVDAFYRIAQDRANKIVILSGCRSCAERSGARSGTGVGQVVLEGSRSDPPQHARTFHSTVEGAHRARSWIWTIARRSVGSRSRQINASQE